MDTVNIQLTRPSGEGWRLRATGHDRATGKAVDVDVRNLGLRAALHRAEELVARYAIVSAITLADDECCPYCGAEEQWVTTDPDGLQTRCCGRRAQDDEPLSSEDLDLWEVPANAAGSPETRQILADEAPKAEHTFSVGGGR